MMIAEMKCPWIVAYVQTYKPCKLVEFKLIKQVIWYTYHQYWKYKYTGILCSIFEENFAIYASLTHNQRYPTYDDVATKVKVLESSFICIFKM